jgi:hypothetical protein
MPTLPLSHPLPPPPTYPASFLGTTVAQIPLFIEYISPPQKVQIHVTFLKKLQSTPLSINILSVYYRSYLKVQNNTSSNKTSIQDPFGK